MINKKIKIKLKLVFGAKILFSALKHKNPRNIQKYKDIITDCKSYFNKNIAFNIQWEITVQTIGLLDR